VKIISIFVSKIIFIKRYIYNLFNKYFSDKKEKLKLYLVDHVAVLNDCLPDWREYNSRHKITV
jgi:hypothetical protein